ncbi:MAG: MFS transporter [Chloroflexota bacterium]|nr:MAG: MFS transporter [Chloroflexota bacterium]
MCARPFVGWRLDRDRRVVIHILGSLVFVTASLAYIAVGSIGALLIVRAYHGLGIALSATALPSLADHLALPGRRGEAIALQATSQVVAAAAMPAIGSYIAAIWGTTALFAVCAAAGALGAAVALAIRERPSPREVGPPRPFFEKDAVPSGLVMVGLQISYGTIVSFVPIQAARVGLANPGWFFAGLHLAMLVGQVIGGRASDRHGRAAVLVPALLQCAVGVALIPLMPGTLLLLPAVCIGIGMGAAIPTLFAVAVDRSRPERSGAALGTLGMLLELGIGGGSIAAGIVGQAMGLDAAFLIAAAIAVVAAMGALALRGTSTR